MSKRTHYQVLGVQPDAEDLVIKAAYRALAQRYHPDKWDGDKAMAQQRMAEINAAYAVLSDAVERREYDAELKSTGSDQQFADDTNQDDEFADYFNEKEDDWRFAASYFPNIERHYFNLKKINYGLAVQFKILIIETKKFNDAESIFTKMKQEFLERHFGKDHKILAIVNEFLQQGNKKALLEVNKSVRVLGDSIDTNSLIESLASKWKIERSLIDCIISDRVLPRSDLKPSKPHASSLRTSEWYRCGNCGYIGSLNILDVSKLATKWQHLLQCRRCGNEGAVIP